MENSGGVHQLGTSLTQIQRTVVCSHCSWAASGHQTLLCVLPWTQQLYINEILYSYENDHLYLGVHCYIKCLSATDPLTYRYTDTVKLYSVIKNAVVVGSMAP